MSSRLSSVKIPLRVEGVGWQVIALQVVQVDMLAAFYWARGRANGYPILHDLGTCWNVHQRKLVTERKVCRGKHLPILIADVFCPLH